jgi:beta-lactamase superfamily II metal-dependent hydrolase
LLFAISMAVTINQLNSHGTEASGPFATAIEISGTVERIIFRSIPSPPEFWKLTFKFNSMYSSGDWNLSKATWFGRSAYANDTILDVSIELVDGNGNGELDAEDTMWLVSTSSCLPGHYWGIWTEVLPKYRASHPIESPEVEDGSGYISFYRTLYEPPLTKLTILDVGKGNAAFIKGPSINNFLINTGPGSKAGILVDYLKSMKVRDLFVLFITDDDPGSIGGLDAVLENFTAQYIFLPTRESMSVAYASALESIAEKSDAQLVYGPDFIDGIRSYGFGSYDGLVMKWGDSFDLYFNNGSRPNLSILYSQGPFHFFFSGNSTSEDEAKISQEVSADPDFMRFMVPTTLIQAANYGKDGATSDLFLDMLDVRTVIISVGSDDPALPSPSLEDHLEEKGIQVLRTDEAGNIIYVTDGTRYWRG